MKKSKHNKLLVVLTLLPILLNIVSCTHSSEETKYSEQTYAFHSYSSNYSVKDTNLTAYTRAGDGATYLDVNSFFTSFDGYMNSSCISTKIEDSKLNVTVSKDNSNTYISSFDWSNDTIYVSDTAFFTSYVVETNISIYTKNLNVESITRATGDASRTFNLKDYGLDIAYTNNKVLVPFDILNLLFCSQNYFNIYFNGDAFYGVDSYLKSTDSYYENVIKGSKDQTTPSVEFREYNYACLCFAYDNFYGLQDYRDVGRKASTYIEQNSLKDALLSTDPKTYTEAYYAFYQKALDDGHTSILTPSFYDTTALTEIDILSYLSTRVLNSNVDKVMLYQTQKKIYGNDSSVPNLRYINDDTAVLSLTSFQGGNEEQLNSSTPWEYDTYAYMDHYLSEVIEKGCKNVILDVSINGGGLVVAMLKTLGFMTSEPISQIYHDAFINSYTETKYSVTIPNSKYRELNYALLTSNYSFSCGNTIVAIFKSMGIGKIYGRTSGGGMCSVLPMHLPDGTTLSFSSPSQMQTQDSNGNYHEIESGITPDVEFKQYSNYYDDEFLANTITFD